MVIGSQDWLLILMAAIRPDTLGQSDMGHGYNMPIPKGYRLTGTALDM